MATRYEIQHPSAFLGLSLWWETHSSAAINLMRKTMTVTVRPVRTRRRSPCLSDPLEANYTTLTTSRVYYPTLSLLVDHGSKSGKEKRREDTRRSQSLSFPPPTAEAVSACNNKKKKMVNDVRQSKTIFPGSEEDYYCSRKASFPSTHQPTHPVTWASDGSILLLDKGIHPCCYWECT